MSTDTLPHGLSDSTLLRLRTLFARHPGLQEVLLFGSRALGTHRPGSDIDLCLFSDTWTSRDLLKLDDEMDQLNLPHKTDLLLWREIDHAPLREHILRVGWRLYPA
jgi:predicted nucleotidyltransferase